MHVEVNIFNKKSNLFSKSTNTEQRKRKTCKLHWSF